MCPVLLSSIDFYGCASSSNKPRLQLSEQGRNLLELAVHSAGGKKIQLSLTLLIDCLWNGVVHTRHLLLTDGPLVSLTCKVLLLLILLKAKACEVAKLMASFALKFPAWALKSLQVSGVSTLWTSIFVLVCKFGIKASLKLACSYRFCILVMRLL